MALPARGIVLSVLALACLLAGPGAAAQFVPSQTPSLRSAAQRVAARPSTGTDVALSGPVDPDTYRLGPGDTFVVSIGGSAPRQSTTTVSADGLLVVPEAGTFRAAGRSLSAVRAEARAALRQQFRNVPTDVVLAAPRRFSVYVSGAVPLPGRYTLSALGRIEDALVEATGEANPMDLADYRTPPRAQVERRAALRNVSVTDRDGVETRVDLLRYYATGDLAFNPYLTDGASVNVPTFDVLRDGVTVNGAVDRPGYYDWRPGDTAAALVAVASGTDLNGTIVRRTRTVGSRTESVEVPIRDAETLAVEPRDQLSVLSATPEAGYASVVGAVGFPGAYPIQSGTTTLRDLLEAAGGLNADALVRAAYLERRARTTPEGAAAPLSLPDGRRPTTATFDSTVTSLGQLSELSLVGRRYYVQEYASTPRLSIDIEAALRDGRSIVLRDGDQLVVPRDLAVVRVFGQVGSPGYVAFEPGATAETYIDRAGGLGPAATTVFTVDARTGRFTEGAETLVQSGDAVFVDRPPTSDSPAIENLALQQASLDLQEVRAEREAQRDRRQFLLQIVTTTILTVSSAISTYFLIQRTTP